MTPLTVVKSPTPGAPHVAANRSFPTSIRRDERPARAPALRVLLHAALRG